MRMQPSADTEALRFRAPTLDEAIEQAEKALGASARVVAANHVRRGGIAGFFAADLGVEISVVLDDETVEEALTRLVDEAAQQDGAGAHATDVAVDRDAASPSPSPSLPPRTVAPFAAVMRAAEQDTSAHQGTSTPGVGTPEGGTPGVGTPEGGTPEVGTTEGGHLDTFTSEQLAPSFEQLAPPRARPRDVFVETAMLTMAPSGDVDAASNCPDSVSRSIPGLISRSISRCPTDESCATPASVKPEDATIQRMEAAFASLRSSMPARPANAAASRRQVELVVAATEQIIDTIAQQAMASRSTGRGRVRIVMRNSSGAEIEAEAEWDGATGVRS